eukprot:4561454-Pleurochrysis_carterae.AAC.2
MITTQLSIHHTSSHANQMHSPRSSITLLTANHTATLCAECTQITLENLHQNRSVNFCCSRKLDSRQSHHTCHDRMERANGNGAQWPEMLGRNWPPQNYQFHFGGIA